MQFKSSLCLVALAAATAVSACEGECIVGITKVFQGNYSAPVHLVLANAASQISSQLLPPSARTSDPMHLVEPILSAFDNLSYNALETAIFPSYFHGKCQRFSPDGQDPPGCPDPDCPVVCGTPGSLVHFYSTLRTIAFNTTSALLVNITTPGSEGFQTVENNVMAAQKEGGGGLLSLRGFERSVDHDVLHEGRATAGGSSISSTLQNIFASIPMSLERTCDGGSSDGTGSLPDCSWETAMKQYILTFT